MFFHINLFVTIQRNNPHKLLTKTIKAAIYLEVINKTLIVNTDICIY